MQWRPIETADSETLALLYAPPENLFESPAGKAGEFRVARPRPWTWASHWMPLPAPPPRDAIDELVDAELAHWRPMLGPLVQPLLAEIDKALAQGESLQAFAARLPTLVRQMDDAPLGERLARAAFSARLAGEAELNIDT